MLAGLAETRPGRIDGGVHGTDLPVDVTGDLGAARFEPLAGSHQRSLDPADLRGDPAGDAFSRQAHPFVGRGKR
jgi:hypothetical protein